MRRVSLPGLLLLVLFSAACGDSKTASSAPGLVRLDLYPTAPEPGSPEVVVVGVLPWPKDLALLEADGATLEVHDPESDSGPMFLKISPPAGATEFPASVSIKLHGSFDPATFNKLVLPNDTPRDAWVRCILRHQGVPLLGSTNRARLEPHASKTGVSRAVLEIPAARAVGRMPDELELIFDSLSAPLRLGPIELCSQPLWTWLPTAENGFGMVALEDDARNSVGLSTSRTLESDFVAPSQAELRCSVGIPQPLRQGVKNPVLKVEVAGERGKPLVQRIELESNPQEDSSWHKVRIPLQQFAGQQVRATFSFSIGDKSREGICAVTRPRVESAKPTPRTVLLVTSDTHRADSIGILGQPNSVQTPALDALARRGVLFEDCWSSTNVTIPSHVAIMTATTPRDTGVLDNYTRVTKDAYTLAEAFSAAGFATYAMLSAPHLADRSSGLGQGFDRMSAPRNTNKRPSEQSIRKLMNWLEDSDGQDLFLWLHVFDAHTPYAPPEEFERRYWPADRDAFDPSLPEPEVPAYFRVNLPDGLRDLGLLTARYHGEVSYLDAQLAKLFDVPRIHAGVVALTADHGESLGEHGIFWEHAGLYPQTIHVPLIVAWPGAPAGTRVKEPVFQLDLAQTLLHLAGVEDPLIPGHDLFAVEGGNHGPRFTIASNADRASVTKDGWHLIISLRNYLVTEGPKQVLAPRHRLELFNLKTDPQCEHDLSRSELEMARELRLSLCTWLSSASPRGWGDSGNGNAEMAEHLAQLGYTAQASKATVAPIQPDCKCPECAPFLPLH